MKKHAVFEAAEILVDHAVETYGDDIALIIYYGSHAKGTARESSDLDIAYIPEEGKAFDLMCTFVLDGRPYDFWPVQWSFAEDIANGRSDRQWAVSASLIADAKILYARSEADRERFEALQTRIQELTSSSERGHMVYLALKGYKDVAYQLGQMRLAQADHDNFGLRSAGQQLINSAVNCLALANQTYFSKGAGANMGEILALKRQPAGLEALIRGILFANSSEAVLAQAENLAGGVRGILLAVQKETAEPIPTQEMFKDHYFYIVEYVDKVLSACQNDDDIAAAYTAFMLIELNCAFFAKVDLGYFPSEVNLLGAYWELHQSHGFADLLTPASEGDLVRLAQAAELYGQQMEGWFKSQGIELNCLSSQEELLEFLKK